MSDRYRELIDIGESRTLDENMELVNIRRERNIFHGCCLWGACLRDHLPSAPCCAQHELLRRANENS